MPEQGIYCICMLGFETKTKLVDFCSIICLCFVSVSVFSLLYDFPVFHFSSLCSSSASLKFPFIRLCCLFFLSFSQWSCPAMLWLLCPVCFGLRARQRKTHWHLQLPAKQTNEMQAFAFVSCLEKGKQTQWKL